MPNANPRKRQETSLLMKIDVNIIRKVQSKFTLNLFKIATLNATSVRNKAKNICQFIVNNDLDILTMTETWLKGRKQMRIFMQHFSPVREELAELLWFKRTQ